MKKEKVEGENELIKQTTMNNQQKEKNKMKKNKTYNNMKK